MSSLFTDAERRQAHRQMFEAQCDSILRGTRAATVWELLRGAPFRFGDAARDCCDWSQQMLVWLKDERVAGDHDPIAAVARKLTIDTAMAATDALECLPKAVRAKPEAYEGILRCLLYSATCGFRPSALRIAEAAISRAAEERTPPDEATDLACAAMGWIAASASTPRPMREDRWDKVSSPTGLASKKAQRIKEKFMANTGVPVPPEIQLGTRGGFRVVQKTASPPEGVVVLQQIGNPETVDGRRIRQIFADLVGKGVPLVAVPEIPTVRAKLAAEFPHALAVIDSILSDISGRPHVRLRPTILVGSPGCGKTSFCASLLEHLAVPNIVYPCGGSGDAALAGNGRRWITGEPSTPLSLIKQHNVASPAIVLDELEKVATGKNNGSLHDALMAMMEPRSARRWMDPYVEAEVDISNVIWLGTVNTMDGIPSPLRDRCRVIRFPDPGLEHLPVLAMSVMRAAIAERGWDSRWALPLDGEELQALAHCWPGGSLRKLARLVEGILAAREHSQGLQ